MKVMNMPISLQKKVIQLLSRRQFRHAKELMDNYQASIDTPDLSMIFHSDQAPRAKEAFITSHSSRQRPKQCTHE